MPNVNLAPTDYSTEYANILRQQKMAELMQQQSMQPLEAPPNTAQGWAVKTSPLSALAKMVQGYAGGQGMNQAISRQVALAQRMRSDAQQQIGSMPQGTPASPGAPALPANNDIMQSNQGLDTFDQNPATPAIAPQAAQPASREQLASWAHGAMFSQHPQVAAYASKLAAELDKPVSQDAMYRQTHEDIRHDKPSGSAILGQEGAQRRFEDVSGGTRATLGQAADFRNTLSPYQTATLGQGNQRIGIANAHLALQREAQNPWGAAPSGAPQGSTQPAAPQTPDEIRQGVTTAPINEQALSRMPPALASQVKAVIEGQMPLPPMSRNNPRNAQLRDAVFAVDPSMIEQRNKIRNAYFGATQSKEKDTLTNLNQAYAHAGTLLDLTKAMKNNDIPAMNAAVNWIKTQGGHPEVTNPQVAQQALSEELMRTFRGAGQASEKESERFGDALKAMNGSPAQQQGALKTASELLDKRLKIMEEQYTQGMGHERFKRDLLLPTAKASYDKLHAGAQNRRSTDATTTGGLNSSEEQRYQELLRKQNGS